MFAFTETQRERLAALCADSEIISFENENERDKTYQKLEKEAVKNNKKEISELLGKRREPLIAKITKDIKTALYQNGFAEFFTPSIIPRLYLERMSIDSKHPLFEQVFWLDSKSCMRPMLAPGLYAVSQKLLNFAPLPLKIFEIGSCFRKESEGRSHLKEFTMLNLVEWGTPEDERVDRIRELAAIVLSAANITGYKFESEFSAVYGDGIDVTDSGGMELASSSMGPHALDAAWKISCSWAGIGFGLERIAASAENTDSVHRYARSVSFANGFCLDIK